MSAELLLRTREHLFLVLIPVFAAMVVGIPLGVVASTQSSAGSGPCRLGRVILTVSAVLQSVPSIALLCFLIPIFGVGNPPALIALFLYALAPIVANTYLGLTQVTAAVSGSEKALGLSRQQCLRFIELPLASPRILLGIRTSTTLSIGIATIAALIGAGGYGVPIIRGLALGDLNMVLRGAIPAAVLALVAYAFLTLLSRRLIPKGIQVKSPINQISK